MQPTMELFRVTIKENLGTYQREPKYWRKPVSFIEEVNIVQLLVQSD